MTIPHESNILEPGVITSNGTMFESPFLKLIYLTSLHGSVSYIWTVMRRQSPFVQTPRPLASQLGHGFLLQNMRSYSNMILDSKNSPPFIHMSALVGDQLAPTFVDLELEPPEWLAISQSIVQLYTTKNKQSSGFFWRTIALEHTRLQEQVSYRPFYTFHLLSCSIH